jgi:tripartite-type tricarboxylate transporter receptor subunit TctC
MKMLRASLFLGAALILGTHVMQAQAAAYPDKPIRFVVPFPPGGGTDTLSRSLAQKMADALGQSITIDNRPGAGGNIGADIAAKSAPDGYTIFMGQTSNLAVNPTLYSKLPFDPVRDFAPITLVTDTPLVIVVAQGSPIKNVRDLIALARARPGSINFASPGNGTVGHLSGEMFKREAGVEMMHIPYKGAAPALTDLIGGRVNVYFASAPAAMGQIKGGTIRAIAVTSRKRSPALPDVPTVAESGLPGFGASSWYGILAPAGTPKDIISKLNAAAVKVMQQPELKERMVAEGGEPIGDTPEQFAAFIKSEIAKWAKVVKDSGAHLD